LPEARTFRRRVRHHRGEKASRGRSPERKDHLSLALRASHSGIWDWNIPEGMLYWTPEFMELFGFDPATTVPGFDLWRAAVHPDDRVAAEDHISSAIRDQAQLFNEYRIAFPGLSPAGWRSPSTSWTWLASCGSSAT